MPPASKCVHTILAVNLCVTDLFKHDDNYEPSSPEKPHMTHNNLHTHHLLSVGSSNTIVYAYCSGVITNRATFHSLSCSDWDYKLYGYL